MAESAQRRPIRTMDRAELNGLLVQNFGSYTDDSTTPLSELRRKIVRMQAGRMLTDQQADESLAAEPRPLMDCTDWDESRRHIAAKHGGK